MKLSHNEINDQIDAFMRAGGDIQLCAINERASNERRINDVLAGRDDVNNDDWTTRQMRYAENNYNDEFVKGRS